MNSWFQNTVGSSRIYKLPILAGLLLFLFGVTFILSKNNFIVGLGVITLPFIIWLLIKIFTDPSWGMYSAIVWGFFALGLSRYAEGPYGLLVDGFLVLGLLSIFFNSRKLKPNYKLLNNDIIWLSVVWYLYVLFQLVNPQATSREAWFFFMRGMGLYMLLMTFLVFTTFNTLKHLKTFLMIWAIISLLASIKAIIQNFVGLDPFEHHWLMTEGKSTHFLFGKIRIFSFFSDAGQFGASQGHTGVVFTILALSIKNNRRLKYFFLIVAALGFLGMLLSGTRGAIAVPIAGFFLFIILKKNFRTIIIGFTFMILIFAFFKFTTIGNGNDQIRRMRTAFDTEDNSLNVRLENQKKLARYLADKPFGGGIGNAGKKALRFAPNSFLANVATDSWFVQVWAETGIVGLYLHLFVLFYTIGYGAYIVMFKLKHPELKTIIIALLCGILGIIGASYGNGVINQFPTALLIYPSMAFVFYAPNMEKQLLTKNKEN